MAVKHRNKTRIPLDLEPSLAEHIQDICDKLEIPRTKLLRMITKYGVNHIDEVIQFGDRVGWRPNGPNQ